MKGAATGDVACDSYHRYKEDIALLEALNLTSYRFSIAWPRILPDGAGPPNPKGLDYYKRLADALLEAKIRPLATLYHWDLPQRLEEAGGWPNRDLAARFTDYAELTVRALGDRISNWCLFNEPWVFTFLGYVYGTHAPARKNFADCTRATHVVNIAQGQSFRAFKAINSKLQVGTAFSMANCEPATKSDADRQAAERAHALGNVWFITRRSTANIPKPSPAIIRSSSWASGPATWNFAVPRSIFSASTTTAASSFPLFHPALGKTPPPSHNFDAHEGPLTDFAWEVWLDGFHDLLFRISREYKGMPPEITENGCSYLDCPDERAYHHWSLLDNFEWTEGYAQPTSTSERKSAPSRTPATGTPSALPPAVLRNRAPTIRDRTIITIKK